MRKQVLSIFSLFVFLFSTSAISANIEWSASNWRSRVWLPDNVQKVNAWDMTCKQLQAYARSLKAKGLPQVFYVTEARPLSNVKWLATGGGYLSCARYRLRAFASYRILASNRYCPIRRCGYDVGEDLP